MNNILYGRQRDQKIIQLIEQGSAFNRMQIQQVIFQSKKSAKRIAQHRLTCLTRSGKIKQMHKDKYLSAIYFTKKPKHLEHALMVNDVYTALITQKEPYYVIDFRWEYNVLGGQLRADALIILYTLPDRKGKKVFFLEVERHPSKKFDKPEKYLSVFNSTWYKEEWAVIEGERAIFPKILIVTEEPLKIESKLKFIIAAPEEVSRDVYSILRRS